MVKRLLVMLSAVALVVVVAGAASAFMPAVYQTGDMIMVPMKVTTTYKKSTGGTPGGVSTLLAGGSEQYTADYRPWGPFKFTRVESIVKINPPKCIAPAYGGPVAWGAPPAITPGAKLLSNTEKFTVTSPLCQPTVTGGLSYEMTKKQVVK